MRRIGGDLMSRAGPGGAALGNPSPVRFYNNPGGGNIRGADRLFDQQVEAGFHVRSIRLDDGRYARLVVQGNVQRLDILSSGSAYAAVVESIIIGPDDYVCGIVTASTIIQETPNRIRGLTLTELGAERIDQGVSEVKAAVPLDGIFATLNDSQAQQDHNVLYSQFKRIKPGNYTGTMRQLVQLLLGVGITQVQTFENRLGVDGVLDNVVFTTTELNTDPPVVPIVSGTVNKVLYDYRANKTDGLSWGSDGQCYLMQISPDGLLAMRLPVTSYSRTKKGRDRIALLYPELFTPDASGEGLFDRWGGFPTGEVIGHTTELQAKLNAGEVIRIIPASEMTPFYSKQMYSTALGWAYANSEPIAVNTCWGYDPSGIKKGYLFFTMWNIGDWIEPAWTSEAWLLRSRLPMREQFRLNKLRRMTTDQLDQVSTALDDMQSHITVTAEQLADFKTLYDAIVVNPPVSTTGRLQMQKEGWLYHPTWYAGKGPMCAEPIGHPQIKFVDEESDCNASFNFEPSEPGSKPPKRCDTPMWACWVNDQLFVVSYFWDPSARGLEGIDTHYECQFTGTWVTDLPATTSVQGNFYSNFFDLRRETRTTAAETVVTTGEWAGTSDFYSFGIFFVMCCDITRNVYVNYSSHTTRDAGGSWAAGLAIPFGDRSIIYGACQGVTNSSNESWVYSAPTNVGTTGYTRHGKIYQTVCHWRESGCFSNLTPVQTDNPCVMWEMVPASFTENCLSGFGPPEFPHYQPCDTNPNGSMTHCVLSAKYNDNTTSNQEESWDTPIVHKLEWELRIFGDTAVHGQVLSAGEMSDPDIENLVSPITWWWFVSSPTCDPPLFCKFSAAINRWGTPLVNYDNDLDPVATLHSGIPESMYSYSSSVFTGYVSDEVFDYG